MYPRLALNLISLGLNLPSAEIAGMYHHTWHGIVLIFNAFFSNTSTTKPESPETMKKKVEILEYMKIKNFYKTKYTINKVNRHNNFGKNK
jgi:hypothetical protein